MLNGIWLQSVIEYERNEKQIQVVFCSWYHVERQLSSNCQKKMNLREFQIALLTTNLNRISEIVMQCVESCIIKNKVQAAPFAQPFPLPIIGSPCFYPSMSKV